MDKIEELLKRGQNVYTTADLQTLWQENNPGRLRSAISYYLARQKIFALKRGVYTVNPPASPFEVAQKLVIPSYISLESALQSAGVINQVSNNMSCIAPYNKTFTINSQTYVYHSLKESILFNPLGIQFTKNYALASPERAIADWLYLRGEAYFDDTSEIQKDKLLALCVVYPKKAVQKRIENFAQTL